MLVLCQKLHGVTLQLYADDCQVYASMPVPEVQLAIDGLTRCLADFSDWLDGSRLRLNTGKTEVTWAPSSASTVSIRVSDSV